MKKLLLLAVALSGCTTNGTYDAKKTWLLIGTVAVAGVAASSDSGSGNSNNGPDCYIVVGPSGSDRVCD